MHVQGRERGHNDEVGQDEGPAAGPRAPSSSAQVRHIDADLDRKRTGERLADGDGFAHLLPGEPVSVRNQLAFHLTHEGDGSAKAQQPQAEEIAHQPGDPAALVVMHRGALRNWPARPPLKRVPLRVHA